MSVETWNLIADGRSCIDGLFVEQEGIRLVGRRLSGGIQDGVEIVDITFGELQFTVIPTRGMGLWEARLNGKRFGWHSPVRGPVHPSRVPLNDSSGLGWLDGFDELLVRCGLVSNGAPEFDDRGVLVYPLHGNIANCSAYELSLTIDHRVGELSIAGKVEESRFHFQKLRLTSTYTCKKDKAVLTVKDEVENFGAKPQSAQLLYHWNFGPPLLGFGTRLVAPAKIVVPRNGESAEQAKRWNIVGSAGSAPCEYVYFMQMNTRDDGIAPVVLVNKDESLAAMIEYQPDQLGCFSLWKNEAALNDGYVVGLEPATNWPNPRSFEEQHERIWVIDPGEAKIAQTRLTLIDSARQIANQIGEIDAINRKSQPQVKESIDTSWCHQ